MVNQPCKHLEHLIKDQRSEPLFESIAQYAGSSDNLPTADPSLFIIPEGIRDRSYEFAFRRKLRKYGIEPLKVDILVLRYIYDLNFKEITQELDMLTISTAVRLHSEAIASLKKKGFGNVRKSR